MEDTKKLSIEDLESVAGGVGSQKNYNVEVYCPQGCYSQGFYDLVGANSFIEEHSSRCDKCRKKLYIRSLN